jgi:hypothetical protein
MILFARGIRIAQLHSTSATRILCRRKTAVMLVAAARVGVACSARKLTNDDSA